MLPKVGKGLPTYDARAGIAKIDKNDLVSTKK